MDHSPTPSIPSRTSRLTAAGGLTVAVLLVWLAVGAPMAAPRVVRAALAMPAAQGAAVRVAAIQLAATFGLAGRPGVAVRSADQATGDIVDTVDFKLADGRLTGEIVRASSGRLERLVDLTDPASGPAAVDAAGAPAAARRLIGAAGLAAPGSTPVTTWDAGMDAWCVRWVRTIDGVPAPTDGIVTWVRPSGRLKALSDTSSALADAPPRPIPADVASRAVRGYVRGLHLDALPSLAYDAPRLAASTDPSTLRLAWAVTFGYIPSGWTERHLVEIDVDAATGTLIGGTETA